MASLSVCPQQLGFLILGGPGAPRAADPRQRHQLRVPALSSATGAQLPELQTPSAQTPRPPPASLPNFAKGAYFNPVLVTNTPFPPSLAHSHQALVTRSAFTLEKSKIATSEDTCLKEAMSFP